MLRDSYFANSIQWSITACATRFEVIILNLGERFYNNAQQTDHFVRFDFINSGA